ncbi:uncharacterized protein LOC141563304 isoform X2 [Sminthopsis crassicaudata]|uniref:uncharacterized protein LOC141563304 isoform X2 n=1 Tax=Sminthopsis crassicaudata TaxID=9301 RepID=UPI003D69AFA2
MPGTSYVKRPIQPDFRTVHKEAYDSWDPSNYQQPLKPLHLQDELTNMFRNSNAKFDDSTVTKVSYPPHFKTIKVAKAKQPTSIFRVPEAKFQDVTTNKQFFQKWDVQPRIRYGDIHNEVYVKPTATSVAQLFIIPSSDSKQGQRNHNHRNYNPTHLNKLCVAQEAALCHNFIAAQYHSQTSPGKKLPISSPEIALTEDTICHPVQ